VSSGYDDQRSRGGGYRALQRCLLFNANCFTLGVRPLPLSDESPCSRHSTLLPHPVHSTFPRDSTSRLSLVGTLHVFEAALLVEESIAFLQLPCRVLIPNHNCISFFYYLFVPLEFDIVEQLLSTSLSSLSPSLSAVCPLLPLLPLR
jgi:hypothetical protein